MGMLAMVHFKLLNSNQQGTIDPGAAENLYSYKKDLENVPNVCVLNCHGDKDRTVVGLYLSLSLICRVFRECTLSMECAIFTRCHFLAYADDDDKDLIIIVAAAAAGLVVLLVVLFILFVCYKRYKNEIGKINSNSRSFRASISYIH